MCACMGVYVCGVHACVVCASVWVSVCASVCVCDVTLCIV